MTLSERRLSSPVSGSTNSYWVSMGIYVFDPEIVEWIPEGRHYGFDDLMLDMLRKSQPIRVYPFDGQWLDIGRPEDYERAVLAFRAHRDRFLNGPLEGGTS